MVCIWKSRFIFRCEYGQFLTRVLFLFYYLRQLAGGCFVTKVSPDGSAARSGEIEVGDQLASINGTSSVKMKVDDICDMITTSSDPSQIELVFLRYIGPFRPRPSTMTLQPKGSLIAENNVASIDRTDRKPISMWKKNPIKIKSSLRLFGRGKKNK